jgi:hypothetical protein
MIKSLYESLGRVAAVREDVCVDIASASIAIRLAEVAVPQPAAHEDRGEQPILDRAELLAHDTDEP